MWNGVKDFGHRLAASVLSTLYPSACPSCGSPSDHMVYAPLCFGCWGKIKRYQGPSCSVCSTPLVSEYARVCGDCLAHRPSFSSALSYGLYSDSLREAVHLLKFSGIRRLAKPLGGFLHELPVPPVDGIVPVPLSRKSLRERGFNQTLLLAKEISRFLDTPVYMDVLYKKRETLPQIGLRAKERLSNLKNAFEVVGDVKDKKLLLLDDVMTTGATVRECSKALVKAGAKEVIVVALARSSRD